MDDNTVQTIYDAAISAHGLSENGSVILGEDRIVLDTLFSQSAVLYADIKKIEISEYKLFIHTYSGTIVLSSMGEKCEWCFRDVCELYNKKVLSSLLVTGTADIEMRGTFRCFEDGKTISGEATVSLFPECLCILPENDCARRIAYAFIVSMDVGGYELSIKLSTGDSYKFSAMGYDYEPLCRNITEHIRSVQQKNSEFIKELDSSLGMVQTASVSKLLPEKLTVLLKSLEAVPSLKNTVEAKISNCRLKQSLAALRSLCDLSECCVGLCRVSEEELERLRTALLLKLNENAAEEISELTAEQEDALKWKLWIVVPCKDSDTAIVEFSLPGEDTATFLFKTGGNWSEFTSKMSSALEATDLQREVFFLTEEQLATESHSAERILISRTPSVAFLRKRFADRVIHRSGDSWLNRIKLSVQRGASVAETPQKAQQKFCTACGAELRSDMKFCGQCGKKL